MTPCNCRTILSVSLIVLTLTASSQVRVSGWVHDSCTGESLVHAVIFDSISQRSTISNNYGFYSLQLTKQQKAKLFVSFLGYQTFSCDANLHADTLINLHLTSKPEAIEELVVSAERSIHTQVQMSSINLSNAQIQHLPEIGGETDILKAYQLMPGIIQGGEGSSNILVRGGESDQNLILLDDVPLYYVNHLGGFVSVFNSDMIKDASLIKGGFPARYGNRLSSIMDVRMKDGNTQEWAGSATLGMLTSRLSLEGPLKPNTTSMILSVRRFMWDVLYLRPLSYILSEGNTNIGYYFYDINAKIQHRISSKNRVYLSFYLGDDKISTRLKEKEAVSKAHAKLKWGNMLGAIRWNHTYHSRLFSNITVAHTRFRYLSENSNKFRYEEGYEETNSNLYSGIRDISIKIDYEYYHNDRYTVLFGADQIIHNFKPGVSTYSESKNSISLIDTTFNNQKLFSYENNVYLENQLNLGDKIKLNLGLRFNAYYDLNHRYFSVEPRISGLFLLHPNMSLKYSYTRVQQNIHQIDYPNLYLPGADIWIPTMNDIVPEKASQYAIGLSATSRNDTYIFEIEGYYKALKDLMYLKPGAGFSHGIGWEDQIAQGGTGQSYGTELLVQRRGKLLEGWVSYSYSRSTRSFEGVNQGKAFPFQYDRPHSFNVHASYNVRKNFSLSALWIYQTGLPITLRNGTLVSPDFNYPGEENRVNDLNVPSEYALYTSTNSLRIENYHRLDLSMQHKKQKKRGERIWKLSIYNAYNRMNPYFYFWKSVSINGNEELRLYKKTLFPIMPSISYTFNF